MNVKLILINFKIYNNYLYIALVDYFFLILTKYKN